MLQKIRGIDNVDKEFQDLINASEEAKKVQHPWRNFVQPIIGLNSFFAPSFPFSNNLLASMLSCFMHPSFSKLWVLKTTHPSYQQ